MFEIVEEPGRLLRVARTGVWTQAVAARYRLAMQRALAGADRASPPLLLLIDITVAGTLPKEAMDEMAGTAQAIGRSAVRRCAVVGDSAVARLQAKRLLGPMVEYDSFDTMAEAREWLTGPLAEPPAR
ncbi:MAG: STAS/SEC14 domain-containing protein [Janthinobacterium lividum]